MNTATVINPDQADHTMTLANVLRHVELVEHVLRKVMKKDVHYGASFPGDTKMNLLKPGADKLCLAFQLAPAFEVDERDLGGDHREYRVTCRLTTPNGRVMGEGLGACSTKETKYRWRNSARKCPNCGKETIIKGKDEYGGGWVCFAKKGGCGSKWPDGAKVIEAQDGGKVENPDIADVYNTCLKIGKKRAYVDATITATAASDLFTQDLEDLERQADRAETEAEAKRPAAAQPGTDRHAKAPGTDRHTNHAAPAAAASTAAKSASGSAVAPASTNAAPAAGMDPKAACTDLYAVTKRELGDRWATAVWKHTSASWQVRMDTLREINEAVVEIRRVVGDNQADAQVDNAFGNVDLTPESVQGIRHYLVKASRGEVDNAEHQQAVAAGAVKDDSPPF